MKRTYLKTNYKLMSFFFPPFFCPCQQCSWNICLLSIYINYLPLCEIWIDHDKHAEKRHAAIRIYNVFMIFTFVFCLSDCSFVFWHHESHLYFKTNHVYRSNTTAPNWWRLSYNLNLNFGGSTPPDDTAGPFPSLSGRPPHHFSPQPSPSFFLPLFLLLSLWIGLVSSQLYVTEEEDSKKMQDKSH